MQIIGALIIGGVGMFLALSGVALLVSGIELFARDPVMHIAGFMVVMYSVITMLFGALATLGSAGVLRRRPWGALLAGTLGAIVAVVGGALVIGTFSVGAAAVVCVTALGVVLLTAGSWRPRRR